MNESLVIEKEFQNRTDEIKGSVRDWVGGKKIDLNRKLKSGKTVKETLSAHLKDTLNQETKNHKQLCDNLKKWQKIYKGKKDKKVYPYINCANTAVPVARSSADALYVRIRDAIFNKQRIFLFKPKQNISEEEEKRLRAQEIAFNHYVQHDLGIKRKTSSPMQQCVISGTGIAKIDYEVKNRVFYRYANQDELNDRNVEKYKSGEGKDPASQGPVGCIPWTELV